MTTLIVDGGPENNNRNVEDAIEGLPVRKLIAGVQINCSNSMIEAVNKIMKYRYLFGKPIPSPEALEREFPKMIADFNGRPHYALSGLTPNEAYCGKVFDKKKYHRRIVEAEIARRVINGQSCPRVPVLPEKRCLEKREVSKGDPVRSETGEQRVASECEPISRSLPTNFRAVVW
jgi:hypothetical protein